MENPSRYKKCHIKPNILLIPFVLIHYYYPYKKNKENKKYIRGLHFSNNLQKYLVRSYKSDFGKN